jgi:hypothetical protein
MYRGRKIVRNKDLPEGYLFIYSRVPPGEGRMHHLLFQKIAADRNKTEIFKCMPGRCALEATLNFVTVRLPPNVLI